MALLISTLRQEAGQLFTIPDAEPAAGSTYRLDPSITPDSPLQAPDSSGSSHAPVLRSRRADRRLLKNKHCPPQHVVPPLSRASSAPIVPQSASYTYPKVVVEATAILARASLVASTPISAPPQISATQPSEAKSSTPQSTKARLRTLRTSSPGYTVRKTQSSDSQGRDSYLSPGPDPMSTPRSPRTAVERESEPPDAVSQWSQHQHQRLTAARAQVALQSSINDRIPERPSRLSLVDLKRPVERLQRRDETIPLVSKSLAPPSPSFVRRLDSYFQSPIVRGETNYLREYSPPLASPSIEYPLLPSPGLANLPAPPSETAIAPALLEPGKTAVHNERDKRKRSGAGFWPVKKQMLSHGRQIHAAKSTNDIPVVMSSPSVTISSPTDAQIPTTMNRRTSLTLREPRASSYFGLPSHMYQRSSGSTPSTTVSPMTAVQHVHEPDVHTVVEHQTGKSATFPPMFKPMRPRLKHRNTLESIPDHSLSSVNIRRTLKAVASTVGVQRTVELMPYNVKEYEGGVHEVGNVVAICAQEAPACKLSNETVRVRTGGRVKDFLLDMRSAAFDSSLIKAARSSGQAIVRRKSVLRPSRSFLRRPQEYLQRSLLQRSFEPLRPQASRGSFATVQQPLTGPPCSNDGSRRGSVGCVSFEYSLADLEVTDFYQTPFSTRYYDTRRAEKLAHRSLLQEALLHLQQRTDDSDYAEAEYYELNVPDHLPSSPLCPLSPKHASSGLGLCPMHRRKKAVTLEPSTLSSPSFSRPRMVAHRAPRIMYEGREGHEPAESEWAALKRKTLEEQKGMNA